MTIYAGSCHCGAISFEIEAEIDHVRVCDCSVCHKRGALNYRVEKNDLILHSDWNELALYQWGSKTAKDYFCKVCGILPFRRPSDPTTEEIEHGIEPFEGWAVNVRCISGIDLKSLPKKEIFGSKIRQCT